jgi:hypothetical protein
MRGFGWACSSAGEHYVDIVGVTGSIPVTPTIQVAEIAILLFHSPSAEDSDQGIRKHIGSAKRDLTSGTEVLQASPHCPGAKALAVRSVTLPILTLRIDGEPARAIGSDAIAPRQRLHACSRRSVAKSDSWFHDLAPPVAPLVVCCPITFLHEAHEVSLHRKGVGYMASGTPPRSCSSTPA